MCVFYIFRFTTIFEQINITRRDYNYCFDFPEKVRRMRSFRSSVRVYRAIGYKRTTKTTSLTLKTYAITIFVTQN